MKTEEINKALEELSNEFKKKVLDHFTKEGYLVNLNSLDFSVENINSKKEDLIGMTRKCHVNSQGQIDCH